VLSAGKEMDCGCHASSAYSWQFCVCSVYFWFGKGHLYGGGMPSSCSVLLSKMWVCYRGTVCSLVITFCVKCAENDSAVLMIAEGNDNHLSALFTGFAEKMA